VTYFRGVSANYSISLIEFDSAGVLAAAHDLIERQAGLWAQEFGGLSNWDGHRVEAIDSIGEGTSRRSRSEQAETIPAAGLELCRDLFRYLRFLMVLVRVEGVRFRLIPTGIVALAIILSFWNEVDSTGARVR